MLIYSPFIRSLCNAVLAMLLLLSLASCQDERWRLPGSSAEEEKVCRNLSLADSLMEERPDSAMTILRHDSAAVVNCSENTRMTYAMLKTQADDKLYVTHKSDSVIRRVVEYFAEYGDSRQQAQAWYLLGRVSYDLHHTSSAMLAWKNVLAIDAEDAVVYRYKATSASWQAAMYEKEKIYEKVLECSQQTYKYAVKSDMSKKLMAYALRDIGRSYSYLGNNKKAITYYIQAGKFAKHIPDEKLGGIIEKELAAIYIEEGMLQEAGDILLHPMKWTIQEELAPFYYTTGKYYEAKGDMDSAVFYYKKNIAIASMYSKTLTVVRLADLYDRQGNHTEAGRYRELGKVYEDSLTTQKHAEVEDNDVNVEEKVKIQKINDELSHNRLVIILCSCLLCIAVVTVLFYIIRKNNRKKRQLSDENKRTAAYWQWVHKQDVGKIQQSQEQITKLQSDLTLQKIQTVREQTTADKPTERQKHEDVDLVEKLNKSIIYTSFGDVKFQPSKEDYIQLEEVLNRAYDNFTERLKLCCPELGKEEIIICCLLKIGVPIKTIGCYLQRSPSALSMTRKRLYAKFFKKEGKPSDFDTFIRKF